MRTVLILLALVLAVGNSHEKSIEKRGLSEILGGATGHYEAYTGGKGSLEFGGGLGGVAGGRARIGEGVTGITVTRHVPVPYPVTVERRVPVSVPVPVDRPIFVPVPDPVPFPVERHIPYPVHVPIPHFRPVEKPVPVPVHVPINVNVPVPVETHIPVPVEVAFPVRQYGEIKSNVPLPVDGFGFSDGNNGYSSSINGSPYEHH